MELGSDDSVVSIDFDLNKLYQKPKDNTCKKFVNKDIMLFVRTLHDTETKFSLPFNYDNQNILAIAYYKCNNKFEKTVNSTIARNYLFYYDRLEVCDDQCKCKTLEKPVKAPFIKLLIGSEVKSVSIKFEMCQEERMIFKYYRYGKEVNYLNDEYSFKNRVFTTTELSDSPIELIVSKYENNQPILNYSLLFEIIKSEYTNERFCYVECNNKQECSCKVPKSPINITSFMCPKLKKYNSDYNETGSRKRSINGPLTCVYFAMKQIRLCQDLCYNMPNCGYLCGKIANGKVVETKYIAQNYPWTNGTVGSKQWSWDKIPLEKVIINECSYSKRLCINKDNKFVVPDSCVDLNYGFKCTKNSVINQTLCLELKSNNPYWTCLKENKTETTNKTNYLIKIIQNAPLDDPEQFMDYIDNIQIDINNTTENETAFSGTNGSTFVSLLNYFEISQMNRAWKLLNSMNKNETIQEFKDVVIITRKLNKNKVKINFKKQSNDTSAEEFFVEFEMSSKKSSYSSFRNKGIYMNSILYNKDFGNEENKSMARVKQLSKSPVSKKQMSLLLRMSPVLSISTNEKVEGIVRFNLKKSSGFENYPGWSVKFEQSCGYLETDNWTWNTSGCKFVVGKSYCECTHMTNFAFLVSIKEINQEHLIIFQILSIIGGIINCSSLLLFIFFVLFINSRDKLRLDQLNVAICLLLGTFIFLLGGLFSLNRTICSMSAIFVQFILMAAFFWKLVIGINVIKMIATIRYQEDWLIKYRTLFIGVSYGVPFIICLICGIVFFNDYGLVSENVCWIVAASPPFLVFLLTISIVVALNLLGLAFIAKVLVINYINTRKTKVNGSNELLVFIQLMVSMGFTWIPCYFATIYLSALYIMILAFPLQGLFMFLLVVVINKENRDKVSNFIVSITSKTQTTSEKSLSKSKSSTRSKGTEQTDSLLSSNNDRLSSTPFDPSILSNKDQTNHSSTFVKNNNHSIDDTIMETKELNNTVV